ncbi:hypothetical protein K1T71_009125 [Dendrolimus kikuchii]|uniref:Uncharacterized protein n=1 Tax=Dendrolimus kikuchii TaxID=765133 RepID=A0ACC1CU84_9NEOP|nr:hypothetical protein K1T71_009125 [Dendrolimus kikuchii]
MTSTCCKFSALVVIYLTVSTHIEANEATTPLQNSPRSKRNQYVLWQWQYWPVGQQSGIGPPIDQYNGYNQNNYDGYNQFTSSNQQYNPLNYEEVQPTRHLEVKREPHLPFDYTIDYTTPVQNILRSIPGYAWVQSSNSGPTYNEVAEHTQNILRDIHNSVFGTGQANALFQTGQSPPIQTQTPYQNNYSNNNYNYVNQDYQNNVNRQQANEVQIQPSVTEATADNTENIHKIQLNTPYNRNQQQTISSPQLQVVASQQSSSSNQYQPMYSQAAYSSNSQWSDGSIPQQNQQANNYYVSNQVEQRPNLSSQSQFISSGQSSFASSNPQPSTLQISSDRTPSFTDTVLDITQFQIASQPQPTNIQSAASSFSGQQLSNVNPPMQIQQKDVIAVQPQAQYETAYQTPAQNPQYTRAPSGPYSQKNTGQNTQRTQTISQKGQQTVIPTSPPVPATQRVTNANNLPFTNIKIESTTKRMLNLPNSKQRTTTVSYITSPKITEKDQVTEKNIDGQLSTSNQRNKTQGVSFKKDSLDFYGTKIEENISFPADQIAQNSTINSEEEEEKEEEEEETIKLTTSPPPLGIKIEDRIGINSPEPPEQVPTTKDPVKECETPASQPPPNFNKPGRRISHTKCYEYVWEQQQRVAKLNAKIECNRDQNKFFYIDGQEGIPAQYPHMAAIGWRGNNGDWLFKCAGALISPKFVLTAARCSRTPTSDNSVLSPVPELVRLGDRQLAERNRFGIISVNVGIKRIIPYPEYSPPQQYNDIALIELDKEITFSKHVQPACLWSKPDTSKLGNQFIATGWGIIDAALEYNPPPTLQKVAVGNIDKDTCNGRINPYCNDNWCGVSDHQICGTYLNGSLDACQGDAGSPLQVKFPLPSDSGGSMHYLIGVSSFRISCRQDNVPTIYTRVSSFIDWIENIVWMSNS